MNITIEKAQLNDIDELEMLYNDICDYLVTKEYNTGWRKGLGLPCSILLNSLVKWKMLNLYGSMSMKIIM